MILTLNDHVRSFCHAKGKGTPTVEAKILIPTHTFSLTSDWTREGRSRQNHCYTDEEPVHGRSIGQRLPHQGNQQLASNGGTCCSDDGGFRRPCDVIEGGPTRFSNDYREWGQILIFGSLIEDDSGDWGKTKNYKSVLKWSWEKRSTTVHCVQCSGTVLNKWEKR